MKTGPLSRYHQVLSAVARSEAGLAAADVGKQVGLPRSTAHRIATSLCEVGYLQQTQSGAYILGSVLDEIIALRLLASDRSRAFMPALRDLVVDLDETAFCARLVDGRVEIVDAVTPSGRRRSHIYPGLGYRPLDKCSSSKAILAFREPGEVEKWLVNDGSAAGFSGNGGGEPLHLELGIVRANGYAVCDGEIDEGVFSIACPVFLEPFGALYSIGVTGPSARMKSRPIEHMVERVRAASDAATARLVAEAAAETRTSRETKKNQLENGSGK
jgi:DNA-binding IclR family transcriptional regulator